MSGVKRVYLFDIDGTLVNAQGVGSAAFRRAVSEILGHDVDWRGPAFAGQTDAGLFDRARREAGQKAEIDAEAFFSSYHRYLEENLGERPATWLPGAESLIRDLALDTGNVIALLTGNTRRGSELKLADLFPVFRFGIFGERHTDRSDLGREARLFADAEFGAGVPLTIIGDTPNDIACARAAGAEAVAVATGNFSMTDLSHADRVLADLRHWPGYGIP